LSWTNNGEIVIDGEKVPNSNIVDLIHNFSRSRKRAPVVGAVELATILKKENVPRECIGMMNVGA
jgi:hypothetical protein